MPMNNDFLKQLLEMMRRQQQMRGQGGGGMAQPSEMGGMGSPGMGMRDPRASLGGLGGMGRISGGGNGMGRGFGGGKPNEAGGWGSGFKPSFGPPQEQIPVPDMGNGGWGAADSWDGPRQSMGQRDAPMPASSMEMPTRPAPDLMGLLQQWKRPKGRWGY